MRDSFIFYRSFYEAIKELPRDVQGEIYTAIMEYSLYGKETEQLKPIARSVFTLIKPQIDVNNKRFDNGCKGGRPITKDIEAKPTDNQPITKLKPTNNQPISKVEPNNNVNYNDNNIIPPISTDVDMPPPLKSDDKISSSDDTTDVSTDNVKYQSFKSDTTPPAQSEDDIAFSSFQDWLNTNARNVTKMQEPFTQGEYLRIRKQYDPKTVKETLLCMHNWKDLRKKNVSANLTFRKWVTKEMQK